MKHIIITIAVFLTYITSIQAQENEKVKFNKYLELGTSLNVMNSHIPRYSIAPYSGSIFGVHAGLVFDKSQAKHHLYWSYAKGMLYSDNELNFTSLTQQMAGYTYQRRVKQFSESFAWYAGVDFSVFFKFYFNTVLDNCGYFTDFAQDLRLTTSLSKEFQWHNRSFYFDYNLKIPVVAFISRRPEALLDDKDTEDVGLSEEDRLSYMYTNGKLNFAGQYSTINSECTLWMPFKKNKNRIGVTYDWRLYTYHDCWDSKQVNGTHSLKITLLTNL